MFCVHSFYTGMHRKAKNIPCNKAGSILGANLKKEKVAYITSKDMARRTNERKLIQNILSSPASTATASTTKTMSSFEKTVKLACKPKAAPPKAKVRPYAGQQQRALTAQ